jgi:hypothetical protein
MKRKPTNAGADRPGWVYITSGGAGVNREHETTPVERVGWPQRCDQCGSVIDSTPQQGTRRFKVSRGLSPSTLYLCGACVAELCVVGGIPQPEVGD